ncbi:uncharacterized protein LOC134527506 isoform X2 [Bacillus rossius redtenbacheri]|uniref:uncharacterized protein LOC134527506 isoform X2 n=1 Tax=Bacillus rossius redtenbacheri TaxID=93214 RepID=UPI002FDCBF72
MYSSLALSASKKQQHPRRSPVVDLAARCSMGMITRVRGRLHSLQALARPAARDQEERTSHTVCLLSVVLLLPYLARGHIPLMVGSMGLAYSCLVLPMVVSINYKYPLAWRPLGWLLPYAARAAAATTVRLRPVFGFLKRVYAPLDRTEQVFIKMSNISTMANQLLFFMACDRVLVPGQKVTCLYSLMFYNVLAYCVSYIKELVQKEDWSPYVTVAGHSSVRHLAMSATKIVLEWTKAVTFVVTVVFMLLVLGLEQGLQHYRPTALYTALTWTYYLATEKVFAEAFPSLLALCRLEALESLEALWAPVLLRALTLLMSLLVAVPLAARPQQHGRLLLALAYVNLHLRVKETRAQSLRGLRSERAVLAPFRRAAPEELAAWDDVCAVCLGAMRRARVTPCHHLFHGDCLRRCLGSSQHCPLCKRQLKLD